MLIYGQVYYLNAVYCKKALGKERTFRLRLCIQEKFLLYVRLNLHYSFNGYETVFLSWHCLPPPDCSSNNPGSIGYKSDGNVSQWQETNKHKSEGEKERHGHSVNVTVLLNCLNKSKRKTIFILAPCILINSIFSNLLRTSFPDFLNEKKVSSRF